MLGSGRIVCGEASLVVTDEGLLDESAMARLRSGQSPVGYAGCNREYACPERCVAKQLCREVATANLFQDADAVLDGT